MQRWFKSTRHFVFVAPIAVVMADDGLGASEGGDGVDGFAPVSNAPVTVQLTNTNGATAPSARRLTNLPARG